MTDKEQIGKCIDVYYAGCCESDSDKIKEAFDNNAMISGYLPDGLHEMNLDEFSEFVSAQQPSPKEKGDKEFLEIISSSILRSSPSMTSCHLWIKFFALLII